MNPFRFFSTVELRFIQNNLHLSDKEIGAGINRTASSIYNIRVRFNLMKYEPPTDEDIEMIKNNLDKSYRQIGEITGLTRLAVKYWMKKLELKQTRWRRAA